MFCGKCGTEVPDGYEFCMKCGSKIEPTQVPKNESSMPKKKKWVIPLIVIVCVVGVIIVALYFINDVKKKNGLYNNIAWGTSYDDIKSMFDDKDGDKKVLTKDDELHVNELIEDYKEDKEISAMVTYDCEDDGTLHKVDLVVTNGDESKFTDEKLYDKYKSELTELYGDSKDDIIGEFWTTKKSKIGLTYWSKGVFVIEYEDITTAKD